MTAEVEAYICHLSRSPDPIRTPILKIGGLPVFLQETPWPACRTCGRQMEILAQITLQHPLRLSNKYQMAYVFICPGDFDERGWLRCHTWDASSGAVAVILQEGSGRIVLPDNVSTYPDYSVTLEHIKEASIDTSDYQLDESLHETVFWGTKIGGVPKWVQENGHPICPQCGGPTKLAAQLDSELDGSLPSDPALLCSCCGTKRSTGSSNLATQV